ncbi:hypothetical protein [Ferrimicrobium sp.]|uniref:hypothetical protein n=2 Tax=Ferrimicrobium sp. TaxID=2926050 RepID=UPI00263817F0|nr:hypothetical protein [Ferrimicrobium sp.]
MQRVSMRAKRFGARLLGAVVVGAGGLGLVVTFAPTAWASGSPTPSTPTAPSPAAGFQTTVLSQTVTPSSSTQTFSAISNGADISISIPAGAFGSQTVQLVVTEPTLSVLTSSLGALGLSSDSLGAGVGIEVVNPSTGQPLTGTFAAPLTVTIVASSITASSKVIEYPSTGSPFVMTSAVVNTGKAVVTVSSDPGFAVATPTSAVVPAATSPVTGKNFLPEGIAAGVLMTVGTSVLVSSRRRHRA